MTQLQPSRGAAHAIKTPCTDAIVDRAAGIGLRPAAGDDIDGARDLAAELIGSDIATTATLKAVQAVCPTSVLVVRDEHGVSGVLAALLLRPGGRLEVESGRFDGVGVNLDLLCRPGETPAAFYAWGCAARSRDAARVVVTGAAELTRLFVFVPRFARAATAAGARTLTASMGYLPAGGVKDLYWLPAEPVR